MDGCSIPEASSAALPNDSYTAAIYAARSSGECVTRIGIMTPPTSDLSAFAQAIGKYTTVRGTCAERQFTPLRFALRHPAEADPSR